jgi:hypothetical protein
MILQTDNDLGSYSFFENILDNFHPDISKELSKIETLHHLNDLSHSLQNSFFCVPTHCITLTEVIKE